jgi:hypothetical protein
LEEDQKKNRMHESIELFDSIINERGFKRKSAILFYNKEDLFKKKIAKVDLSVCFDDYKGGKKYENALKFIKNKFESLNQNKKRDIHTFNTTATDTKVILKVFGSVHSIIVKTILTKQNLL